jgi:hypothetical protein
MQSPPPLKRGFGIAWLLRSTILRLEQVDVSATGDVERMSEWTKHSPLVAL